MSSIRGWSLLALLALLATFTSSFTPILSVDGAVIAAIQPRSGSLLGGQQLTLTGTGFMREGTEGMTRAFIGNNECKMIEVSPTTKEERTTRK